MKRHCLLFVLLLSVLAACRPGGDTNADASLADVSEVTPEGAWCWFADPRALHYASPDGTLNRSFVGYIDIHGNIKAMQYDFVAQTQEEVLIRSYFQPDDHDNPTFLALPDGRIMVFYSRHTDEPCFYYRVSRLPADLTTLGPEKVIPTKQNTTYPSPFILKADPEHIYLCWRGIGWHPTIARLTLPDQDDNVSFDWGPFQMVQSTGARPYAKYMSDGDSRIFLAYTTGHPDNEMPNHLYFNYVDVKTRQLKDVEGNVLSDIAQGPFHVDKTPAYAERHPLTVVDRPTEWRDWLWQVAADAQGRPVMAMVRINEDKTAHDYYYARWDGRQWQLSFLTHAGGHFHQTPGLELCYSAGMAIDPAHPSTVYCSVPVEGEHGRVYELLRYEVADDGQVAAPDTLTHDSPKNNVRPYVLPGSEGSPLRLVWMYGDYYDWIVSQQRPQGYCTAIRAAFAGFDRPAEPAALPADATPEFDPATDFTLEREVSLTDLPADGVLLDLGTLQYVLDAQTLKPAVRYAGQTWSSTNVMGTADSWQQHPRGTNGKWPAPVPYDTVRLKLVNRGGTLSVYVNGLLDQKISF